MTTISYEVGQHTGELEWAVSEYFEELNDKSFMLGAMEASEIAKRADLSETAKILLSGVAGAVIQRLLDQEVPASEIFAHGKMHIANT